MMDAIEMELRQQERMARRQAVAKVLYDAALLIEHRGWIKHNFETDKGLCTLGAIRLAADGNRVLKVDAAMALMESLGVDRIVRWNDRAWRTKRQVLRALRGAADAVLTR